MSVMLKPAPQTARGNSFPRLALRYSQLRRCCSYTSSGWLSCSRAIFARLWRNALSLRLDTPRNAQPAAVATDAINFMDALKIDKAIMGGFDWGGRNADLLAFLWPERVKALVSVSGYLVGSQAAVQMPLPPAPRTNGGICFISPQTAARSAMPSTPKTSTGSSGSKPHRSGRSMMKRSSAPQRLLKIRISFISLSTITAGI